MGTQSRLPTIRLNELQTIGYQICPDASERCCGAGVNLAECLGVLHFPVEDDDGFIPLLWRLRPDSPGAVAFVATRRGEPFLSHMVPSVTKVQKRNLLSDPIFQQEDLFAPATIGAARHAAKDVSLYKGAQSRPSASSGTTQRRPSSSSLASRGRTQSSSAPATPQRSQASSSSKRFYAPEEVARSPEGVFGGRSLSHICGPVGFIIDLGLKTAPQVFTRLIAPISAILHRYGIRMLRYLDDWLILAESRTACLQARDRLLPVCEELRLQVNFKKSSLIPSQDMTYMACRSSQFGSLQNQQRQG